MKRAQVFLRTENLDPKGCSSNTECDGVMTDTVRNAIIAFLKKNFDDNSVFNDNQRQRIWKAKKFSKISERLKNMSDLDLIYSFNRFVLEK